MNKYVIIDAEALEKRIEELLHDNKELTYSDEAIPYGLAAIAGKIELLKQILSQSTPLIPEISKAYDAGIKDKELSQMFDNPKGRYVYNLKLDI